MSSSSSSKGSSRLPTSRIARPPSTAPNRPQNVQLGGTRSNAQSPEPPPLPKPESFIIGDRVWVSGTKPGNIVFLGETKFADGDWAGVVLDDASGKNDGTVQGVRYFQCPPKRGIFTRLTNLRREPKSLRGPAGDNFSDGTASEAGSFVSPPTSITDEVGPQGDAAPLSPAASNNNNSGTTAPHASSMPASGDFRVGERVLVLSGSRNGTLRYLGSTEFAKGCWAGVELDEPSGKNDGSVAGKRYFACKPNYGLFAPLHKIAKPGAAKGAKPKVMPGATLAKSGVRSSEPNLLNSSVRMGLSSGQARPVTPVPKFPRTSLGRLRSGSQESVSSVGSNFSSASRTRVKLGVTALNTNQRSNNNSTGKSALSSGTPRRASTSQISTSKGISVTALQKVLREKEEHIDQLLKERDMERAELVRASAQADKADARRTETEIERDRLLAEFAARLEAAEAKLETAERERQDLQMKYDDEKRKVEELMFEMEEENIDKSTLETKTEEDESKIFELEEALSNEKERADVAEEKAKQLKELYEAEKKKVTEAEESAVVYLEQVESLQSRLSSSDVLQAKDRSQSDLFKAQLDEKDAQLRAVREQLEGLERQLKESERNASDLSEENSNLAKRRGNLEAQLEDVAGRLAEAEEQRRAAEEERKAVSARINAVEADLAAAVARADSLSATKASLQAQVESANAAAAGSENELQAAMARLREELAEKDSALSAAEEARSRLDLRVRQLEAELQEEAARRQEELSGQSRRFESQIQTLQTKVEESLKQHEADVASLQSRLSHAAESHREALEAERAAATARTEDLQQRLKTAEEQLEAAREQLEETKQREEEAAARTEEVSREKSRLELSLRTAEADRAELIQAKRGAVEDRERLAANVLAAEEEMTETRAKLETLTKEKDTAMEEKIKAMKSQTELKARSDELLMRAECLQKEKAELETKVAGLEAELEKAGASADAAAQERIAALSTELGQANKCLQEARQMNTRLEGEHLNLVSEIGKLKTIMEEKTKLQRERDELQGMLKEMRTKYAHLESVNTRAQVQLSDVAEEMKKSRDQLISLTREHEALKGKHRMNLEAKEKDRKRLEDKIRALEQKAKDESSNDGRRRSSTSSDQQIDFLNSVIVELQSKNHTLQRDIEVLTGSAPDFQNNGHSTPRASLPSRPYCDICEEFDLHDTEDCPRQMSSSDHAATRSHGDRNALRPYCDTCEVFGHWTKDCDDELTF